MSKLFDTIKAGMDDALAFAKGDATRGRIVRPKVPKKFNVKAIRQKMAMSRTEFAQVYGFSLRTLEKWERGERQPEGPARALLAVIAKNPKAVAEALAEYK